MSVAFSIPRLRFGLIFDGNTSPKHERGILVATRSV